METFSALLTFCAGNSPVPGEFPAQRPVTRSFDVFFELHVNKQLSKQSPGWWFETPSGSLWRQCNVLCYALLWSCTDLLICIWRCCLHNGVHFVSAAMCWIKSVLFNALHDNKDFKQHQTISFKMGDDISGGHFTNMDEFNSQHEYVITCPVTCGLELYTQLPNVWESISNSIQHFIMDVITYPCRD